MAFFTYIQNNSYGSFVYDEDRGISRFVIVEAPNARVANYFAKGIGLYFDGDVDCPCCGSRWTEAYDDEGTDEPMLYGETVGEFKINRKWIAGYEAFIHYMDNTVEGLFN